MEALSEAHDDSSGANPSSVKSDDGSPSHDGDRGSPPPNCAICLGRCRNKSFTDSCLHQFCFKCLVTWSKVKTECPLCKQNFKSIIHNVQSNQQYEEYRVEQRRHEEDRIDIDDLVTATRRFRYRTTLTIPRGGEHMALQRLLMHYPPLSAMVGMSRDLPGISPAALPSSRRRRSPSSFRRTVYRHNLWARPLPDFTGRHRDCTPEFYRYNHSQMHRLVPWLNRELHYLLLENAGHITYVLSRILELLPQYHITSPEFREDMYRYFGTRTDHFLHELHCFASTPYDLTGYDRNVQYTTDSRISNTVNDVISSSDTESGDSDIVLVTPRSPQYRSRSSPTYRPVTPIAPGLFEGAGPSARRLPEPVYPQNHITSPIEAARLARNVIPIETISNSDTDDEVMVTGYIKPPNQRTPEVVDLRDSDDSDVVVTEGPTPDLRNFVKLTLSRPHAAQSDSEDGDATYSPPAGTSLMRRYRGSSSEPARNTPSPRTPSPRTPTTHNEGAERTANGSPDARDSNVGRGARRRCIRRSGDAEREAVPAAESAPAAAVAGPSSANGRSTPEEERRERERRRKSKSSNGKGVKSSRRDTATNTEPSTEPPVPDEPQPGRSTSPAGRKKTTRWDTGATDSSTPEAAVQEEPRSGQSRPSGKPGITSRRDDGPADAETVVSTVREEPRPESSRSAGRAGRISRDDSVTDSRTVETVVQEEPRSGIGRRFFKPVLGSSRTAARAGKSSRREEDATDSRTAETTVQEEPRSGRSKSAGKAGKSSRRNDGATDSRTGETTVRDESRLGSTKSAEKAGRSSRRDDGATESRTAETTVRDESRSGSSRSAGRAGKSSRRDDSTESRRAEPAGEREDPEPAPSSRSRVWKVRRDEVESHRTESTVEARPGPSREVSSGASNTTKRKNTEEIPNRRNSRDSKRLKSVVKKTSSWSSTAHSSSAVSGSSSAVRPSSSAARHSSSTSRPMSNVSSSSASTSSSSTSSSSTSSSSRSRVRSSSCDTPPRERRSPDFFTDSDDDIPLNLTIQRSAGQP